MKAAARVRAALRAKAKGQGPMLGTKAWPMVENSKAKGKPRAKALGPKPSQRLGPRLGQGSRQGPGPKLG